MFHPFAKSEKTGLEEARDQALLELKNFTTDDALYEQTLKHVKTLSKLIEAEAHEKLNPNTVALIAGNAFVALIVVSYESKNVVGTKVISFLMKATR